MRTSIDLNIRCNFEGANTYVGFEDVEGELPKVGDVVEVWVEGTTITGTGTVILLDEPSELIYLNVEWSALRMD